MVAEAPVDPSERRAVDYLEEERSLRCKRFSKTEQKSRKTPDFKVFDGDELVFYCEVKGMREDEEFEQMLAAAPPGVVVAKGGNDPTYNRVASKIHEASKQFDAVNPDRTTPNVLFLVNDDDASDHRDLMAVVTGGLPCEDGSWFWGFRKYSEGRIAGSKRRIDLFVWLEPDGQARFHFSKVDRGHFETLLRLFGIDEEQVQEVPG